MSTPQKWKDTPQSAFKRIATGLRNFKNHSVGAAKLIAEAKEREIWKLKYDSFQEFAEKECGFSRSWAYELLKLSDKTRQLECATVKESDAGRVNLTDTKTANSLGNTQHLSRGQDSALKGLSADKKAEVFAAATNASDGKSPTPKEITAARKALSNGEAEVIRDVFGRPIPEHPLQFWNRRHEFDEQMKKISEVKCWAERAQELRERDDLMFAQVNLQDIITKCTSIFHQLRMTKPFAVCSSCQGETWDSCKLCARRGILGESRWKTVPEETRNFIEKQYAEYAN